MKKKISFLISILVIFVAANVEAEIDFAKNYDYYEKICSKRSSYEINKQACLEFEEYKKKTNSETTKMEDSLTDSKMNADKLSKLIQQNDKIVAKKEKLIKENKRKMAESKRKMALLDKDVLDRLSTMQYFSDENQIIDIIMGSTNLENLMTRIDGISQINKANIEAIYDLDKTEKELEDNQKNLEEDIKKLNKTKKKQKQLLREFRRKEADLYSKMSSGGSSGAVYNDSIEKIDLSKLKDNSKWGRPIKKGVVTARTWYYSGGGWHPGIDVSNKVGTPITAPAKGALLATANSGGGYGKHIVIVTKKGDYVYTLIFAHLSDFAGVNGFNKGDAIAYLGNTGASTGPHVHVEVLRHNTADVSTVVNQYKKQKDYWFGLGYSSKGDCNKVCRLEPTSVFNLKMGQSY
ncbi:murein DD-endopeptidase MepM/ murein hydrolase activator NlpD [Bacilli bacterium PM5-3]|nr:murein DD-endopeptidase MepM/ murein hydrolase activator NlpD [Bacilli bacterium PM5-3]MDH6603158.1 murein DD-endopeptidase MepM/ murein hydrolase activator NlpD [Bacilli bacterium PM5-9]